MNTPSHIINDGTAASSSGSPASVKKPATIKIERIKRKLQKQEFNKKVHYLCQLAGTPPEMLTLEMIKTLLSDFSDVELKTLLTTPCPEMRNTTPLQRFNKTGGADVCAYLNSIVSLVIIAEASHHQNNRLLSQAPSTTWFKPVDSGSSSSSSSSHITLTKGQRSFIASNSTLAIDQQRLLSWMSIENQALSLNTFEVLLSRISVERLRTLWETPSSAIKGGKPMASVPVNKLQIDKLNVLKQRLAAEPAAVNSRSSFSSAKM